MKGMQTIELSGHAVAYGRDGKKFQTKCVACGDTLTFEIPSDFTDEDMVLLQYYAFYDYYENHCRMGNSNLEDVIIEKIKTKYVGSINESNTRMKISTDLSAILPDTADMDEVMEMYVSLGF